MLLAYIRRIALDAFWSRISTTIQGNYDKVQRMLSFSEAVVLDDHFVYNTPFIPFDNCGYEVIVVILLYSTNNGIRHDCHLQYNLIRKC